MEAKVESSGQNQKEVFISVSMDDLKPEFEKAYHEYQKDVALNGFRKGKVPLSLLKQLLGKKIRQEIAAKLVEEYLGRYIEENKLNVVPPSEIDDFKYDEQNGLSFKAVVEVEPEIELTKIQDFEFEKEIIEVDDAAIEKALDNLREEHGVMNVIETESKENDYVLVDFQKIDSTGVPIIGQKINDHFFQLNLEKGEELKVLSEQLIGAKAGDTRRVVLDDIGAEEDEPKMVHYEATIKEVKSKTLANLDDEFAKDVGNYESLDELKAALRKRLAYQSKQYWQNNFQHAVMDELVKSNPIELSDKLIDFHLNFYLESYKKGMQKGDMPVDEAKFKEEYRADTIWNLKWRMIRDKIKDTQNMTVEENDYEVYYNETATLYNTDIDRIRNRYLKPNDKEELSLKLMEQKVVDWVVAHSKITELRKSYSEKFSA